MKRSIYVVSGPLHFLGLQIFSKSAILIVCTSHKFFNCKFSTKNVSLIRSERTSSIDNFFSPNIISFFDILSPPFWTSVLFNWTWRFSFCFERNKAYYVPMTHFYLGAPEQISKEIALKAKAQLPLCLKWQLNGCYPSWPAC